MNSPSPTPQPPSSFSPKPTSSSVFDPPPRSLSALEIWALAVTKPSLHTFEEILQSPGVSAGRAFSWIFVSSLISYGLAVLLQLILNGFQFSNTDLGLNLPIMLGSVGLMMLCLAPVAAVLPVLGFIINTAILQWVAGGLDGKGSFSQLCIALAAFSAPITLIATLVAVIPFVNLLSILIGVYSLVLTVMAVSAVNRFSYGKAVASLFLVWLGMLVITLFIVAMLLVLLGPAIDSFYQEFMQQMMQNMPPLP